MNVTCALADTTDNTKTVTLASVDGTKITATTNDSSPSTATVNGADFNLGVQNANNVGFTVSAFLTISTNVLPPAGTGAAITVHNHTTDSTLVLVEVGTNVARTLKAAELKDAIANCLRNT